MTSSATMTPPAAALEAVRAAYEAGLYLEAFRRAAPLGPLASWRGPRGRTMAGRLALALGASRTGYVQLLRAGRQHPDDLEARYFYCRAVLATRGPMAAWLAMRNMPDVDGASADIQADWYALRATVNGHFRDFAVARHWLARAEAASPDRPWLAVEKAHLLELQDRHAKALASARRALGVPSSYRAAAGVAARLLQRLGRDDEALDLLQEATERSDAGSLLAQRAVLEADMGRVEEARLSLDRYAERMPLLDEDGQRWLEAQRCDLACLADDLSGAKDHAEKATSPFYLRVATHLSHATPADRRVQLAVPFVQQHHLTCAPASIAAIAAYWGQPVDHLTLATEICYDGTANHRARRWLVDHGWTVREFSVSWDMARALIDRGLPFALVTVYATNAHEQAVIGYDARRGVILLRDPSGPHVAEALCAELTQAQRPSGPRGMVFVPTGLSDRLAGLELAEARLYDARFTMDEALHRHDRETAEHALAALVAEDSDHHLTWLARDALASYDGDPFGSLAALDVMTGRFPDCEWLALNRLGRLHGLGRFAEHDAEVARRGRDRRQDPVFAQLLAATLRLDARTLTEATRLLRRALTARHDAGSSLWELASLRWEQHDRDLARDIYRLAACAEPTHEGYARSYFTAARITGAAEDAISFLRDRVRATRGLSSLPAQTLFHALESLDRSEKAFAALHEARESHRDDGDLALFTAEAEARAGRHERAAELVAEAQGNVREISLRRTAARLAAFRGDLPGALTQWRAVVKDDPTDVDAQRETTRLLERLEGANAAQAHARAAATAESHNLALQQLFLDTLRPEGPATLEPALREHLARNGGDAWGWRELALTLAALGRVTEALRTLDEAERINPSAPAQLGVRGLLLKQAGRAPEAREALRAALRCDVEYLAALNALFALATTPDEREECLSFVCGEIERQPRCGAALLPLRAWARTTIPRERVLAMLRGFVATRPEVWAATCGLAAELADQGSLEEALAVTRRATDRFPLVADVWMERAQVHGMRRETEEELRALEEAMHVAPQATEAARRLVEVHERLGNRDARRRALSVLLARDPGDAVAHGAQAELLWQEAQQEEALASLQRAVRLAPDYEWAWDRLAAWASEVGHPDLPVETAQALTQERPHDASVWLALAGVLSTSGRPLEEQLAAFDRALALNPRLTIAHDLKAVALARAGRHEEAAAACQPAVFANAPALPLEGRIAWIDAERGRVGEAIRSMRVLLERAPDYQWGWECLTIWIRDSGSPREYLEVAQSLLRVAPRQASAHGHLGDAYHRLGDLASAQAEYERAVVLAPESRFWTLRLFDVQIQRADHAGAEATLSRSGASLTPIEEARCRVRLHAACGDIKGALAELEKAWLLADSSPGLAPAYRAILSELGFVALHGLVRERIEHVSPAAMSELAEVLCDFPGTGWIEELLRSLLPHDALAAPVLGVCIECLPQDPATLERARALIERAPDVARHWLMLARALKGPEALEEQLQALDRARELDPGDDEALDFKTYILAMAGRYEEARATCRAIGDASGDRPIEARGREAWVEAQAGNVQQAMGAMTAVLEEEPWYEWGWQRLIEWHYRHDVDRAGFVSAAETYTEVFPGLATGFGYLGAARQRAGDRPGACEAWWRALELSPDYSWVAQELFDVLFQQGDLEAAQRALAGCEGDAFTLVRWVQLHAKRKRPAHALGAFRKLCLNRETGVETMEFAMARLNSAGYGGDAASVLREMAGRQDANPLVGRFLIEQGVVSATWEGWRADIERLAGHPAARTEGVMAALRRAVENKDGRTVTRLARHLKREIQADDRIWGQVGWAYVSLGHYRRAAEWLSSWRGRKELEPWMLTNVVVAMEARGRSAEADAAAQTGATLSGSDASVRVRIWATLYDALERDAHQAWEALAGIDVGVLDTCYQFLWYLGRAAAGLRKAAAATRGDASLEARDAVRRAESSLPDFRSRPELLRMYRRTLSRIAQHSSFRGWLWARLRI